MAQLLSSYHNTYTFHPCNPTIPRARFTAQRCRSLKISISATRRSLLIGAMQPPSAEGEEPSTKGEAKETRPLAVPPGGSTIPLASIPVWTRWVLGAIVCVAIPFYKKVLRIEDAGEKAAETAVELVERVAEVTQKIATDIAESLPDGGKLKKEILEVVRIADKVDKDAERADAIIHKVDEVTDELETVLEPIIEQGEILEKEADEEKIQKNKVPSISTDSSKSS